MNTFRQFIEEENLISKRNRPEIVSFAHLSTINGKHIKPGTKIYRGLKLPIESRKMQVRQILLQGSKYKNNKNQSDPWTMDFPVAERFASGAAINPQGYSLGSKNTVHIIVEAELDGPNKDQIDWGYWGKTIAGQGVSKGEDVQSYWNPHKVGQVEIKDYHIENEIPILHSAYPTLKITAVYVKDPEGQKWIKKTKPEIFG